LNNFENKVVWITGASSGIGEATAIAFAKLNAKIVLSSRRKDELERVGKLCNLNENQILILPFDLNNISLFESNVNTIINKFGKIDLLFNNGGFSQRSEALKTPLEIDRQIMEVNYFANIALTKLVLPIMIKQQSGQIVVISSIAGKFGFFFRSSYSAAKHALHGFYESLRLETEQHGIRVLIVCPGKIKTNISINALTEDGKKHNKMDESHKDAMSAEICVSNIIEAVKKNREELLVGGREIKAVWLKRFFPNFLTRILRKQSPF
jgi:dehydrogenase/reductase SDR family protein 7B